MMLEATCGRCGETFVPESEQPDDLIHGVTELGAECGGTGTVDGAWYAPGESMPCTAFGTGCGGTVTDGVCGTCGAVAATPDVKRHPDLPNTPLVPGSRAARGVTA